MKSLGLLLLSICIGLSFGVEPTLPDSFLSCPQIWSGLVYFQTVKEIRSVHFWASDPSKVGPLYVYWHGTGNQPSQVLNALGSVVDDILSSGGVIAAPNKSPKSGVIPWFMTEPNDLDLMDMIVHCLKSRIDPKRIHSFGYSAGGLITSRIALEKSKYIASVALYSGGILPGRSYPFGQPENHFATMAFHGGSSDNVVVNFKDTTSRFMTKVKLNSKSHMFLTCNHHQGHSIPDNVGSSIHQFFIDHPYGKEPSPYENELPDYVPSYCVKSELQNSEIPVNSSCDPGYYFDSKEKVCYSCPDNSDSPPNSQSISQCQCLPGYTRVDMVCKACPAGTYKETGGDDPCDFCPDYSTSPSSSTSKYNCECIEGYTGKEGEDCYACPEKTYKNETGSVPCTLCPSNTQSLKASTSIQQCTCQAGFDSFVGEVYECTAVSIVVLSVTIGGMAFVSLLGALFWFLRRTRYYQRENHRRNIDEIEQENLISEER